MPNLFDSIKLTKPKNNAFDLSHDVKLSLDMGTLVPTLALECVPGDRFNIGCDSLIRFSPMVAPPMHRIDVSHHYFFVPNRLLWKNWDKFITNTKLDSTGELPAFPKSKIEADGSNYTRLMDYLGLPDPLQNGVAASSEDISLLPFIAYQLIYNEFYRDQNLMPDLSEDLAALPDGGVTPTDPLMATYTMLRRRAWEHDYFTAALPFAQKGDAVGLPIGNITLDNDWGANGSRPDMEQIDGTEPSGPATFNQDTVGGQTRLQNAANSAPVAYDPDGSLVNTPTTINDLRRAFRLQEWLEKQARGGSRYIENILTHFGVKSSDKRLQRPEYITGVKSPVIISEVLNTAGGKVGDADALPQGNMAGHGVSVQQGKFGGYYCEEHGYIIGIMSIMPKTAYMQGVPKHFQKLNSPFDYFWPSFSNIGEQEVKNSELYAFTGNGDETFGYVPRYSEYKFLNSRVAGDFRSSLNFWHLARIFGAPPALNQDFIKCFPDDRIFAVTAPDVDSIYAHVLHKINAVRPMPKFGNPSF